MHRAYRLRNETGMFSIEPEQKIHRGVPNYDGISEGILLFFSQIGKNSPWSGSRHLLCLLTGARVTQAEKMCARLKVYVYHKVLNGATSLRAGVLLTPIAILLSHVERSVTWKLSERSGTLRTTNTSFLNAMQIYS